VPQPFPEGGRDKNTDTAIAGKRLSEAEAAFGPVLKEIPSWA